MLPDPRSYGRGDSDDALLKLADGAHARELVNALRELAAAGRDEEIRNAFASASSQPQYARLVNALAAASEKPAREDAVEPRVFAIPREIDSRGRAPPVLTCLLPAVAALARVLHEHGVFGGSRNVGFSNALCDIGVVDTLGPSAVMQGFERLRDVAPAPIRVLRGVEQVDVRLLIGAAVSAPHAPDISETGANIGAWGSAALRAMAAQLATPNVDILPMPRPPRGLYSAAYAGRRAGLESAFNLFVSNAVRRFRLQVGDPSVTLSSHANGEIRVTLWTNLDDAMTEGFNWPLHPADDLDEVEHTLAALFAECRLPEPAIHPQVLPDRTETGAILYPTSL
jgi:hypothetical protein